jgi:hypothetical protein
MMRATGRVLALLAFGSLLAASIASAQATRTWVSGVGDDVNPCSRTAPCKTLAGAISKTAAGGVISILDPGGYGGVTITQSITIDGTAVGGSVLVAGTNGVTISTLATDVVVLRNMAIEGIGSGLAGVSVVGAIKGLHIEHCRISAFVGRGVDFRPTNAGTGTDGDPQAVLYVSDSEVVQNRAAGIYVLGAKAVVEHSRLEGNTVGVKATGAGAVATVRSSTVAGSMGTGVVADNGGLVEISDSVVSLGLFGMGAATAGTVVATGTTIMGNTLGAFTWDGTGVLATGGGNRLFDNGSAPGTLSAFTNTLVLR